MRGVDKLMAILLAIFLVTWCWKFMPRAAAADRIWTITIIAQGTAAGTVLLYLDQFEQLVQGFNARGKAIEELNKKSKGCA